MTFTPLQAAERFEWFADAADQAVKEATSPDDVNRNGGKRSAYRECATFLREHCQLRWTKEPPIQPGVYWCRMPKADHKHVVTLWLERYTDLEPELVLSTGSPGDPIPLSRWVKRGYEWSGPLPEPIDP